MNAKEREVLRGLVKLHGFMAVLDELRFAAYAAASKDDKAKEIHAALCDAWDRIEGIYPNNEE
ncbi:MAG: hypothetical protein K2R98_19340 [Gemmataceae bacterium]|nr:hypothetical protein [Gemmataceae bacterium]